ncbi:hypothetical protein [Nostoc sp. DSM 114160]
MLKELAIYAVVRCAIADNNLGDVNNRLRPRTLGQRKQKHYSKA